MSIGGVAAICKHCGRPIASLNQNDMIVWVGSSPYHYACTQPPTQPMPQRTFQPLQPVERGTWWPGKTK